MRYLECFAIDSDIEDKENAIFLHEEDIPGASLGGQDVAALKVPKLKRWLQCRRASIKGKKADSVMRYGDQHIQSVHTHILYFSGKVFLHLAVTESACVPYG